jgi:hypothetical protein
MPVTNPADFEVRSVIEFLNLKNILPVKIHRQVVGVYWEGVIKKGNVRKWCRLIRRGRTNVHNETRSGRPSSGVCLLHNNARLHIAEKRQN